MKHTWRCVAALALTVVALAGCADDDTQQAVEPAGSASSAPTSSSSPSPSPTAVEGPTADCEATLEAAVEAKFPGYTPIALDRCAGGWAYLGSAGTAGDGETLWRVADDEWQWVTSMPSRLCPVDLQDMGAPTWVVHLFDYRDYDC